jgi:hypothetical protein
MNLLVIRLYNNIIAYYGITICQVLATENLFSYFQHEYVKHIEKNN